jgi:hypothetical protein
MRTVRAVLVVAGVACGLWGVWLMRDFTRGQLTSEGFWLAGGVVLHDAVLAPVVVVVGHLASRLLPRHFRGPIATAFLIWGTLTIVFLPVLSGQGGKAGNDTILGRPYVLSWLVMTLLLAGYAAVAGARRRIRSARAS